VAYVSGVTADWAITKWTVFRNYRISQAGRHAAAQPNASKFWSKKMITI